MEQMDKLTKGMEIAGKAADTANKAITMGTAIANGDVKGALTSGLSAVAGGLSIGGGEVLQTASQVANTASQAVTFGFACAEGDLQGALTSGLSMTSSGIGAFGSSMGLNDNQVGQITSGIAMATGAVNFGFAAKNKDTLGMISSGMAIGSGAVGFAGSTIAEKMQNKDTDFVSRYNEVFTDENSENNTNVMFAQPDATPNQSYLNANMNLDANNILDRTANREFADADLTEKSTVSAVDTLLNEAKIAKNTEKQEGSYSSDKMKESINTLKSKLENDLVNKYSKTDADLSKDEMKDLRKDIKNTVKDAAKSGALGKLGDVITSSKNAKTMYAIQMAGHSLEAATGALGVYTEVDALTKQLKAIKASHEANAQGQEATTQQVEQKPDYSAEIAARASRYLRNK